MNTQKQHINTYIHKIINYLREKKEWTSFLRIKEDTDINLLINPMLITNIKKNPRIEARINELRYKPLYSIKTKEDFLKILTESEIGIEYVDLIDCSNDKIDTWIDEENEKIMILRDSDDSKVLFWNHLEVEKAPQAILELFNKIKVPNYVDLIAEMNESGMKVQRTEMIRKNVSTGMQKKKYKRKIKITNTHVKDLKWE